MSNETQFTLDGDGAASPAKPRKSKQPKAVAEQAGEPRRAAPPKGLNYTALIFLVLLVLGPVIGGCIWLYDRLYPEQAMVGRFRTDLVRCYTAANPKKLSNVESLVKKHGQNDRARRKFWSAMIERYPKTSECHY